MRVIKNVSEMQRISHKHKEQGKKIAVVPTMGYLHEGHLSLVRYAQELADIVITSIFVNPKQFGPNEDFDQYPRDFNRDNSLLEATGCDYVFYPDVSDIYPLNFATEINMSGVASVLEGESRPGHFNGVALVVLKLFNITKADISIFGQKDFQQTLVIKQLVRDFNLDIQLIIYPIVREPNGLAMSSRNRYLSEVEREKASIIFVALDEAKKVVAKGERRRKMINSVILTTLRQVPELKIDYVYTAKAENLEIADEFLPGEEIVMLIAVWMGRTRLIDNSITKIPITLNDNNFIEGL